MVVVLALQMASLVLMECMDWLDEVAQLVQDLESGDYSRTNNCFESPDKNPKLVD
jgi:hypothetical protein